MNWRDVLVALAPYHHCAHRLGLDPVEIFERASADSPADLQLVCREFARRLDITLNGFGWTLTTLSDGPCYEPV